MFISSAGERRSFISPLAGQPGVARAFALRAEVCRFVPVAPLSFLASRSLHQEVNTLPHEENCSSIVELAKQQLLLLEKVTRVIKHYCVHYRQKKKSKEKRELNVKLQHNNAASLPPWLNPTLSLRDRLTPG